jgi:hypothetical protein
LSINELGMLPTKSNKINYPSGVNVLNEHHPTIGDMMFNTYLKSDVPNSQTGVLPTM